MQVQYPSGRVERPRQKIGCAFWLLPISAVIMLGVGVWFGYTSFDFYSNGFEVEGTVVRLAESSDSDGTSYSPVYRYQVDGRDYEYESINSSNPPAQAVGDVEVLLVDPDDPERARVNSFWELWLIPMIFLPLSIFMLVLSVVIPVVVRLS